MTQLPANADLTIVQGSTFLAIYHDHTQDQIITLTGSGTDPFTMTLYSSTTTAMPRLATATEMQNALAALPKVTSSGVSVSGADGGPWTIKWGGDLFGVSVPKIQVNPGAGTLPSVEWTSVDWTGWAADFKIKTIDTAIPPNYVTTVVALTDTLSSDGQIILGYVPADTIGGTPGTPDPTNGNVAILIEATTTAAMTGWGMTGAAAARHGLQLINGTFNMTILDGNTFLRSEANV